MCLRWRRHTSVDGFFRKCSGLKLPQTLSGSEPSVPVRCWWSSGSSPTLLASVVFRPSMTLGCVKTSSRLFVSAQFAEAIDEAVH